MTRRGWLALARLAGAAAVLGFIVARFGAGPFLAGLRSVSAGALVAACGIAVVTTACCAWRWCLVARGLGVPLRFGTAFAAYYRSQFLNGVLPGGILGDIHRGMRHGRDAGNLGRGLRAMVWERSAGQAVQAAVVLLVLGVVASPMRATIPAVLVAGAVCAAAAVVAVRLASREGRSPWARFGRMVVADLREGVAARARWPGVAGTSLVVVAGHAATFLIAARAAGSTAPVGKLLPLTLLILLAAAVPANLGGWGPREGLAAWAFAWVGLGAAHGLAASTAYGVLVAAASLPGAVVLAAGWFAERSRRAPAAEPQRAGDIVLPRYAASSRSGAD